MIPGGRGAMGLFEKKKEGSTKSDEKIVCSQNWQKMGLYEGKNWLVPFSEEKRFASGWE